HDASVVRFVAQKQVVGLPGVGPHLRVRLAILHLDGVGAQLNDDVPARGPDSPRIDCQGRQGENRGQPSRRHAAPPEWTNSTLAKPISGIRASPENRQGDRETRRQGKKSISLSPCLLVSLSPHRPISLPNYR